MCCPAGTGGRLAGGDADQHLIQLHALSAARVQRAAAAGPGTGTARPGTASAAQPGTASAGPSGPSSGGPGHSGACCRGPGRVGVSLDVCSRRAARGPSAGCWSRTVGVRVRRGCRRQCAALCVPPSNTESCAHFLDLWTPFKQAATLLLSPQRGSPPRRGCREHLLAGRRPRQAECGWMPPGSCRAGYAHMRSSLPAFSA